MSSQTEKPANTGLNQNYFTMSKEIYEIFTRTKTGEYGKKTVVVNTLEERVNMINGLKNSIVCRIYPGQKLHRYNKSKDLVKRLKKMTG